MALKPELQEFLKQVEAIKAVLLAHGYKRTQMGEREAFATMQRKYMTDIDYTMFAIDDVVYNGKYPVAFRIYRPRLDIPLPVAVFIHGGGHTCGSVSQYDGIARKIAKTTQHIVISIDYRLSPEFAYPTGLNDCKAVIKDVFNILDERKFSYINKNLCIIGDSAGGALCASITMDEQFITAHQIKRQILIYPSLDYSLSSPSLVKYGTGYGLDTVRIEWYYNNYCQNDEERKKISPLWGPFYSNMPETLIISAGYDPLVDEAVQYHANMLKIGVKSNHITLDGLIHAFLSLEDLCKDECAQVYQEIRAFLTVV